MSKNIDLSLLPNEIKILIYEYNVDHRPKLKLVLNELVTECNIRSYIDNICLNCGDELSDGQLIRTYILWKKYTFCCLRCNFETDDAIRRSFRRRK